MEEFASKILLIYREGAFHPTHENHGKTELIVARNIAGKTGAVTLWLHPDFVSFSGNGCIDNGIK